MRPLIACVAGLVLAHGGAQSRRFTNAAGHHTYVFWNSLSVSNLPFSDYSIPLSLDDSGRLVPTPLWLLHLHRNDLIYGHRTPRICR